MAKRQAEKDELAGANFFLTISLPPSMPPVNESEQSVEHFKKFAKGTFFNFDILCIFNSM